MIFAKSWRNICIKYQLSEDLPVCLPHPPDPNALALGVGETAPLPTCAHAALYNVFFYTCILKSNFTWKRYTAEMMVGPYLCTKPSHQDLRKFADSPSVHWENPRIFKCTYRFGGDQRLWACCLPLFYLEGERRTGWAGLAGGWVAAWQSADPRWRAPGSCSPWKPVQVGQRYRYRKLFWGY